jgi:hypothetical protein
MNQLKTRFGTPDGYTYFIDELGIIHQEDPQPFTYDAAYCSTYDTPEYRRESDKLMAMRYAFMIACHGKRPDSVLDFGCGNGAFVDFCNQQTSAIGYDIAPGPGKIDYLVPADVITFWDALEHVPDLDATLAVLECETICVSLPCCHYHTLGMEWFDTWKHRKPNEHLHHFNCPQLERLLWNHGYKCVAFCNIEDLVRKPVDKYTNIITMGFRRI